MSGITTWNPNTGLGVVGLEWFPATVDHVTLNDENECIVTQFTATETGTIAALQAYAAEVDDDGTWLQVDVYEDSLPTNITPATVIAKPRDNANAISYNMVQGLPPTSNLQVALVNDGDPTTFHYAYPALQPHVRFYESWSGGAPWSIWQNNRVLSIRILGQVDNTYADGFSQPVTFEPMLICGMSQARWNGVVATPAVWDPQIRVWTGWTPTVVPPRQTTDTPTGTADSSTQTPTTFAALDSGEITINPYGNRAWTSRGLLDFIGGPGYDSATPSRGWNSWGVRLSSAYAAGGSARVLDLSMQITYLSTEERVAYGSTRVDTPGWAIVNVNKEVTSGLQQGFQMTAGKTYFCVWRLLRDANRTRTVGSLTIRRLTGQMNHGFIRGGYASTYEKLDNPYGLVGSYPLGATKRYAAMLPVKSDFSIAHDGVPYTNIQYVPVLSSSSAQQEITPPVNTTITVARFVAAIERGTVPADRLTVALRVRSTDALVAQTDVDISELVRPNTSGQTVSAIFASPVTLTAGTQYYLHFTCPSQGWLIALLNVDGESVASGASFGGTTDRFSWLGFDNDGDAPVALYPSAPNVSGFSVTPVAATVEAAAYPLPGVQISWTPTSLGTLFSSYEIQRWDDQSGFQTIATLTTESSAVLNDWEHRYGSTVVYRMRVINAFDVPGSWTSIATITVPLSDCRYTFTTNEQPSLNLTGIDVDASSGSTSTRLWSPTVPSAYQELYGRSGGVRFADLEPRGDKFGLKLLLYNAVGDPQRLLPTGVQGRRAFDPWLNLARSNVSYICVRNEKGDRWYSSIEPAINTSIESDSLYYVELAVQESTFVPSAVTE